MPTHSIMIRLHGITPRLLNAWPREDSSMRAACGAADAQILSARWSVVSCRQGTLHSATWHQHVHRERAARWHPHSTPASCRHILSISHLARGWPMPHRRLPSRGAAPLRLRYRKARKRSTARRHQEPRHHQMRGDFCGELRHLAAGAKSLLVDSDIQGSQGAQGWCKSPAGRK